MNAYELKQLWEKEYDDPLKQELWNCLQLLNQLIGKFSPSSKEYGLCHKRIEEIRKALELRF